MKSLLRSFAAIAFTVGLIVSSAGTAYAEPVGDAPTVPVPPPADMPVPGYVEGGGNIAEPIVLPPQVNEAPPQPPPVVEPPPAPSIPEPVVQAPPEPEPVIVEAPEPPVAPPVVEAPPQVPQPIPVNVPDPVEVQQPVEVDLPAEAPPNEQPKPVINPDPPVVDRPAAPVDDAPLVNPPVLPEAPSDPVPAVVPENDQPVAPKQEQQAPNGAEQSTVDQDSEQTKRDEKPVTPVALPKPDEPVVPPEVLNQAPVTAKVERVNERDDDDDRPGRGGNHGRDDNDRDNGHDGRDDDRDRPPRPGHDRPHNPWDDHDGQHGNNGNGHHNDDDDDGRPHRPPRRPPVNIDHDRHGNVIINQYYTQVINQIIINQPIINPVSYVYLRNWDTNDVYRFRAGIDGRFVLPSGWCGGAGGYWSVSGGIQVPGFSAYGSAGGFFTTGGCGYVPPPRPPVAYPPQLYVAPPPNYYGAPPVNLGQYYVPRQGCGCVYAPDYNTTLYGGFQNQQFVPTGYSTESVFRQAPVQGYPQWLDDGFGGLPSISDQPSTERQAVFFGLAVLVLLAAGYATIRWRRNLQANE